MSRFLFVVPPLVGHTNPLVGLGTELLAAGHEVAWAGNPELIAALAGPEALVFGCDTPEHGLQRTADLRGPAAFQFLWDSFLIPLAEQMAPGVHAAIERFAPDVVVADQQAVAGGLIADGLGLPWVTSATTSAELISPLAGLPKVEAWLTGLLEQLRGRIVGGLGSADPRMSPHGVLAFTTRELLGPVEIPHERVWFVGPSITSRPADSDFPWEWLDPALPAVLVTLGTANLDAGARFLGEAAEAVHAMAGRVQAVVLDPGGTIDAGALGPHVLVRDRVPQLRLLEHTAAVVCHGGHNTVCESLWHAVPLVIAPIRDDQPIVATQVCEAGAGVRVRFNRVTAPRIIESIDAVLAEGNQYRAGARRVSESFRAAGGSRAGAARLIELAGSTVPATAPATPGRAPLEIR